MSENTSDVTAQQRKLYLHHKVWPKDPSYNLLFAFRIEGELDTERLRSALDRLARGTSGLNVVFTEIDGKLLVRRVPPPAPPAVTSIRRPGDATEWLLARMRRIAAEPLRLEVAPLYSLTLVEDDEAVFVLIVAHHLVGDIFTFYNVVADVERLYAQPEAGPSPGMTFSPTDFLELPGSGEEAVEYFRSAIGDLPTLAHERLETGRNAEGVIEGRRARFPLDDDASLRIAGTIAALGVRPFSFFLGVHALWVAALTGDRRVVVGVPLGNRRRDPRMKGAYGYFVNTLPLVVDVDRYDRFGDLCRDVEAQMARLIQFEDFDVSAHATAVFGSAMHGRLTTSNSFTFYRDPVALRLPGCVVEPLDIERQQLIYPLLAGVEYADGQVAYNLQFSTELAGSDPVACLQSIIASVATGTDADLSAVRPVAAGSAAAIDALVNQGAAFDPPPSLAAWFERCAREVPERTALEHGEDRWSYARLNATANRVARRLREQVPGQYVAVSLERGGELIAVLLGILKAGKTYVPIDPQAPAARVGHILGQFEEIPLICGEGVLPVLPVAAQRLPLTRLLAECADHAPEDLPASDLRDRAAYVIFTSGSTGRPKGVQVTHANVMRLFLASQEHFTFGPDDVWCLFHSYAFDFSVWEMFGALLYGGKLVIVPEKVCKSPDGFLELLVSSGVTVLNQTPSAFRGLSAVLEPQHRDRLAVRYVVFGGEELRFSSLRRWHAVMGERAELVNMYGITETTVHVTHHRITADEILGAEASVVGRPLADLAVRVVDRNLHRVPLGVPGEILVAGAGVAVGYLGRPELTAERFLRLPGSPQVWYRTGDLARVRPDGELCYLGRIDQQVQLRGYRIELGEVETALRSVPGVLDCAVLLDQRRPEDPQLVAFTVATPVADERAVRDVMRTLLPGYMLPTRYVPLAALPLTINGKIDVPALPWPEQGVGAAPSSAETDPAASLTMRRVGRIWREVLELSGFGPDDRFFDVGGSSAHITQVHERLCREFDVPELDLIDLFTFTTVRELADQLDLLIGARSHDTRPTPDLAPAQSPRSLR